MGVKKCCVLYEESEERRRMCMTTVMFVVCTALDVDERCREDDRSQNSSLKCETTEDFWDRPTQVILCMWPTNFQQ